jgi:uncharacterized protein (DUF924 family)
MTEIGADDVGRTSDVSPPAPPGAAEWDEVLGFWFPDSPEEDLETHSRHWAWRMRGGADSEIVARFTGLAERAASGSLDHWARDPVGRCALIVVLDQFSRSVWSGTPRAFEQDPKALALSLEGIENGHFDALPFPWQRTAYQLSLGHCEGPDHLARLDCALALAEAIRDMAPDHLKAHYSFGVEQKVLHRRVIEAYGRYPHRNAVLGRTSTPEEAAYVAEGKFPHRRPVPLGNQSKGGHSG